MQPITTRSLRHVITFVVLCTALLQAHAARFALVIGNDQYQAVDKLKNARNDATLMAGVLKKAGFDVTQASDLGRERLWSTIDTFKARLGKGDEVVFYFAGHGVQIGSNQLLLPTDIKALNESQVQRDGVPLVDIQDALKDARVAVFIIDACRDNPFPKVGTRSLGATRGLLPPEPSTGQIIMLSAGRNQKALDEVPGVRSTNGLFTWELAQVLQTPGLEIRVALEQVKEAVDDKARRARHEQRPSLVNDLRGSFYFIAPVANAAVSQTTPATTPRQQTAEEAEQELWDSIKNANSVEALNAYLQEFPRGKFVAQARVLIAKLRATAPSPMITTLAPVVPVEKAHALSGGPAARAGEVFKDCDVCPEMVLIPGGSFTMASDDYQGEKPPHRVTIKMFALGKFEVTQSQWKAVMGSTPSHFGNCGDDCPVERVSWNDIQEYIQRLNQRSGKTYRLASNAEWEYAATAGSTGKWSHGDTEAQLGEYAWYSANSGGRIQRVGQKKPNAFGLYDMHGNVWEWVQDCWHNNYSGAPRDGSAWTTGCSNNDRVLRGGAWSSGPALLRSPLGVRQAPENRSYISGFRLARTVF